MNKESLQEMSKDVLNLMNDKISSLIEDKNVDVFTMFQQKTNKSSKTLRNWRNGKSAPLPSSIESFWTDFLEEDIPETVLNYLEQKNYTPKCKQRKTIDSTDLFLTNKLAESIYRSVEVGKKLSYDQVLKSNGVAGLEALDLLISSELISLNGDELKIESSITENNMRYYVSAKNHIEKFPIQSFLNNVKNNDYKRNGVFNNFHLIPKSKVGEFATQLNDFMQSKLEELENSAIDNNEEAVTIETTTLLSILNIDEEVKQ